MNLVIRVTAFFLLSFLLISCGNRRSPTGGKPDIEQPEIVSISPEPYSDISSKLIEITFSKPIDRNTVYEGDRGVYFYPLIENKRFRWSDNKLLIEINEELKQDSNYFLSLSDNIRDLRGNNLDRNYLYIFHTGNLRDYRIDGHILYESEEDIGKPVTFNILSADSLRIFTKKFTGNRFNINYLNDQPHILRAFIDKNNNKRYDVNTEPFSQTELPTRHYYQTTVFLEYVDETKPEIRSAQARYNNFFVVNLNKPVRRLADISIHSSEDPQLSLPVIGYGFFENTIEVITEPMDSLKYKAIFLNVEDNKGNIAEELQTEFEYNTGIDTLAVEVKTFSPRDGAVVETLNPALRLTFSKHIFTDDVRYQVINTSTGEVVPSGITRFDSRSFIIVPDEYLHNRQTYRLTVLEETTDATGNNLNEPFELNFLPIVTD